MARYSRRGIHSNLTSTILIFPVSVVNHVVRADRNSRLIAAGEPAQDAEVSARLPRSLRQHRGRPGRLRQVLPFVEPLASPLGPGPADAGHGPPRAGRRGADRTAGRDMARRGRRLSNPWSFCWLDNYCVSDRPVGQLLCLGLANILVRRRRKSAISNGRFDKIYVAHHWLT